MKTLFGVMFLCAAGLVLAGEGIELIKTEDGIPVLEAKPILQNIKLTVIDEKAAITSTSKIGILQYSGNEKIELFKGGHTYAVSVWVKPDIDAKPQCRGFLRSG